MLSIIKSVRFSPELRQAIQVAAQRENRTVSEIIRDALIQYLSIHQKEN